MPLYDCMLLFKPVIRKEGLIDLVARIGKHVYSRNGVLTEVKSFGKVELGYSIRKLDGRHYQKSKRNEYAKTISQRLQGGGRDS
ncbi:hypothetical protein N665_0103s0021 [Sinapis alba]|nr:hypothetical protein N665_0103s0021 [Sinapis alba]